MRQSKNRGGLFSVSMCGASQQEIEQLSREGSHYSLSTGILPSLGARSNRRVKLSRFIISPYDRRYRAWETFLVVLVIYTAWVSPFEFGFLDKPQGPLSITDNVVNGFFAIDIVLTFFVAYLDRATYLLVDNQKQIAWKYASSWLAFDVISTIPSELARKISPSPFRTYGLFNMLRLWRLRRVSSLFARLEKDRNFNYFWVRCAKLICVTLFAVHCAGCFYYLLAAHYHDPKKTWIGASMNDFLEESLWIREIRFKRHQILRRETVCPLACKIRCLHTCLLKFRTNSEGLQQKETLDSLPKAIRSSISHFLFYSLVDKVYLFRGVSNDLLFQLVSEMKAEYFPPKEDVILQNEAPTDFYILVTGAVVIGEAKTGDLCGEIGVLCYRPQLFTVRTKRLSQLLRMNRATFLNIVQANVGDGTIIMNNLLQHLKETKDPVMEGVLLETENMLARGRMDLPLSLCFATLRGDDLLLHQLLKRGLDPNESDNNGRTALHIAASQGSENCVLVLLDYGADPNSRDSEGNVPVWEALLANHESVAKLLTDNGATISAGDVAQFACTAAEQNKLELLKEIVRHGGDVTLPRSNGSTALHVAVCEGNNEMVKFLLEKGSDIDKPDHHGWTPRDLADQQGHEDIKAIFQATKEAKAQSFVTIPEPQQGTRFLGRFTSEPNIRPMAQDVMEGSWGQSRPRRRTSNFHNSLFGIMSAAHGGNNDLLASINQTKGAETGREYPARVTLSCPEKGDDKGKLVLLPKTFQELLDIGAKKFGFLPTKVRTKDGAEIDDIELIRDGDHIIFVSDGGMGEQ
ncbi:K+ transporter 1 [Actinidia rufa]|uniref:Potassium channel n=1 Tax=Actinidia rufa TaxID=165716 RepID=A0A7J0DMX2_9ERIC|nr:K+ transporter 1 [Actinidia rufa]